MKQETPPPPSQSEPQEEPQRRSGWLATLGRMLRDNAALLAALLALAGVIYTQVVTTNNTQTGLAAQRELEEERAREAELQTYLDDMGQMLLDDDNPLSEADPSDPISTLARAKTLPMLERADKQRKRIVLQFLYESGLIDKDKPIISLMGANLTDADLSRARLDNADLSDASLNNADLASSLNGAVLSRARLPGAHLSGAVLANADLTRTVLVDADLSKANLTNADLINADLTRADLRGANLYDADLSQANLSQANLSGAFGLTTKDLERQAGVRLEGTTMPDGSIYGH